MYKASGEQQFEKTFADLAYSNLRDRSPKMMQFLIGFQLLDKNDDDTKGSGVFIFDINGTPYYGPIFFINGELKGSQLLYIKNADQFIPLQEKWANYIINNKNRPLGKGDEMRGEQTSPDLSVFRDPPTLGKSANFDKLLATPLGVFEGLDLKKTLPMLSKTAKVKLAEAMRDDHNFAEAVMQFYDVNELLKTSSHEKKAASNHPLATTKVEVILPRTKTATDLSADEVKTMISDGVVLRDQRDNTTPVFDGASLKDSQNLVTTSFMNASPGMVARVLGADGSLTRCLIAKVECDHSNAYSHNYQIPLNFGTSQCIVIPLETNGLSVLLSATNQIFIPTDDAPLAKTEYLKYLDEKKVSLFGEGNDTSCHVFLDVAGRAILSGTNITDKPVGAVVSPTSSYIPSAPVFFTYDGPDGVSNAASSSHYKEPELPITVTNGTGIKVTGSSIYVPKRSPMFYIKGITETHITLGNPSSIAFEALQGSDFKRIKINTDGIEYVITDDVAKTSPMSKSSAIIKIATKYGVHGDVASRMVNSAIHGATRGQARYTIKRSAFSDVDQLDFDSETGHMSRKPEVTFDSIEDLLPAPDSANNSDLTDKSRQAAINAAKSGNKEVLDTAVLTGLIEASGATSIIDSYLKTLLSGLDRIGRIIFLYYWHTDKFKDRYGDQDLKALEDSLTTVFDSLGDLILFLKEKTANIDNLLNTGNLELDGSV